MSTALVLEFRVLTKCPRTPCLACLLSSQGMQTHQQDSTVLFSEGCLMGCPTKDTTQHDSQVQKLDFPPHKPMASFTQNPPKERPTYKVQGEQGHSHQSTTDDHTISPAPSPQRKISPTFTLSSVKERHSLRSLSKCGNAAVSFAFATSIRHCISSLSASVSHSVVLTQ